MENLHIYIQEFKFSGSTVVKNSKDEINGTQKTENNHKKIWLSSYVEQTYWNVLIHFKCRDPKEQTFYFFDIKITGGSRFKIKKRLTVTKPKIYEREEGLKDTD